MLQQYQKIINNDQFMHSEERIDEKYLEDMYICKKSGAPN